jgi:hypothetical protein
MPNHHMVVTSFLGGGACAFQEWSELPLYVHLLLKLRMCGAITSTPTIWLYVSLSTVTNSPLPIQLMKYLPISSAQMLFCNHIKSSSKLFYCSVIKLRSFSTTIVSTLIQEPTDGKLHETVPWIQCNMHETFFLPASQTYPLYPIWEKSWQVRC